MATEASCAGSTAPAASHERGTAIVWVPPLGGTRHRLGYLAEPSVPTVFADIDAAIVDPLDPYAAASAIVRRTAAAHTARYGAAMCRGASALTRAILDAPEQFDAAVLLAPFAFAGARHDGTEFMAALSLAAKQEDVTTIEQMLLSTLSEPGRSTTATRAWALACAHRYTQPSTGEILPWLCHAVPTGRLSLSRRKRPQTRILVIAQPGDAVHPVPVAAEIASYFPNATLHLCQTSADIFTRRAELDVMMREFLYAI